LALRKDYSVTVGTRDVAHLLAAFEEMNSCTLALHITAGIRRNQPDLLMTVNAFTKRCADVDPVPLASESFSLSQHNFKALESAIMFALYQIDAKLANEEFAKTQTK